MTSLHVLSLTGQTGLVLITCNVLADQIGLPVPAAPTLMLAGALAVAHPRWGVELFVLATLACVVPDLAWYGAGRLYGNGVMRLLCRVSLSPDSCVSDTQLRFERWGGKALIVAKFVPGLAVIAPPLAGAMRMGWVPFVALTTAGAALWVAACLLGGALFAPQINRLLPLLAQYGGRAVLLIAALLAAYIAYKWWERRRFHARLRMARISVSDLHELVAADRQPVVLDVRSHSARELEPRWIPNALHVPPDEIGARISHLPRDRDIVVYCTCPNEATAARIARLLMNHGFTKVRPLAGGLDAWVAAGYRIDSKSFEDAAPASPAHSASLTGGNSNLQVRKSS